MIFLVLVLLVLLVLLIFLILVLLILILVFFLILLVLLLLLFFEFLEELFHDVTIFLGLLIFRVEVERLGVLFDGVFPVGLFRGFVGGGLAAADEGIREVVGGVFAQLVVLGEQGAREVGDRLFEIAELIRGSPGIELHLPRIGG